MNGDREAILGRVREALRVPAPRHHEKPAPAPGSIATAPFREWLPVVGPTHEDRLASFMRLSESLRTEFVNCPTIELAGAHLAKLASDHGWERLATHAGDLTDVLAEHVRPREVLRIESDYDKNALEACDAGLTECECLVAQTGSVCVTTRSSGGRALSVLPPHHVVIASRAQLLPDLTAAYELLAQKYGASGYPSFMGFINGPSRTGDIERILVLGAHGPKKLTVLLVP
ncbi:MAG: LUD domain-containing protein [Chthoniobacteraceae bacterium]